MSKPANHASILRFLLFFALGLFQATIGYAAAPKLPPNPEPGTGIQRTMRLLASSTPEHRNDVFILFYGQSISKQPWWTTVARDLKERFPWANLRIENRAIGGFTSDRLVKTAEYDLYPADPDLVIFQDYGDEPDYENVIRRIRTRTKAEVALQTDHLTTRGTKPEEAKDFRWAEWHNKVWLPEIARKYGCGLIDIRAGWKSYLTQNKLEPRDFLVDYVHLNAQGNYLMGALVEQYLQYNSKLPQPYEPLSTIALAGAPRDLEVAFTGNRVDVSASRASATPVHFLIDGKRPSEFPNLAVISRPNDSPGKDWPWQVGSILAVGHRTPLVPETWTVKIDSVDQRTQVAQFEVSGSLTGFDGRGSTDRSFVSTSGRVVIDPENWWARGDHDQYVLRPGQLIQWRVLPMGVDQWAPVAANETVTVASGLSNSRHLLHIHTDNSVLPLQDIIVQKPRYSDRGLSLYLMPPYRWQRVLWLHLIAPYTQSGTLWWCCLIFLMGAIAAVSTFLLKRRSWNQTAA